MYGLTMLDWGTAMTAWIRVIIVDINFFVFYLNSTFEDNILKALLEALNQIKLICTNFTSIA